MDSIEINHNNMPAAMMQLFVKLDRIEKLMLQSKLQAAPAPKADPWLSLQQLCDHLPSKPAKQTVYGWICHKSIPFHKKGKRVFFSLAEIDAWLASGRNQTMQEIASEVNNFLSTGK
jgi:excisionase family DNA binding protein